MEKKVPMRTCIACRQAFAKRDLIRIVKSGDVVSLDITGRANGRGAYICKSPECMAKLKKQKLLNRAFECNVEDAVYDKISEEILERK